MMSPTVKLPFASHVEPATPDRVKTATLPSQWLVRRNGRWPPPELSINILLAESVLPAPAPASFGLANSFLPGNAVDLPRMRTYAVSRGQIPLPPEPPWPRRHPHDESVITPLHADGAVVPVQPSDVTSTGAERLTPRRFETAGILRFLFPFSLTGRSSPAQP